MALVDNLHSDALLNALRECSQRVTQALDKLLHAVGPTYENQPSIFIHGIITIML